MRIKLCATVLLLGLVNANADPVVLNFEDHASMDYVSGTVISESAKLSDDYLSSFGVVFSSGDPYVAVIRLGTGHATSGSNGLGGSNAGKLAYSVSYPIIATFFDPTQTTVLGVTDFVSLRTDYWSDGGSMTLKGYDVLGQLIATDTATDTGGVTLSLSVPGIHSIQFAGTSVAVDDFTFNSVAAVPEPTTGVLFAGIGFGAIWLRQRRRGISMAFMLMKLKRLNG
jgi:hypothetical protein